MTGQVTDYLTGSQVERHIDKRSSLDSPAAYAA